MRGEFFDSDVVLEWLSAEAVKSERAEALIVGGGCISVQVLNAVADVGRRKLGLSLEETDLLLQTLCAILDVRPLTLETHDRGVAIARRYQLSVYDSLILASALEAGCETVLSQDMQNGMRIADQLTIHDPFRV